MMDTTGGPARGRADPVVHHLGVSEQQIPSRLVFRVPQVSVLAALLVAICATPITVAIPVLSVIYLVPLAAIVWIVRVRTVADPTGLTVRGLVGETVDFDKPGPLWGA